MVINILIINDVENLDHPDPLEPLAELAPAAGPAHLHRQDGVRLQVQDAQNEDARCEPGVPPSWVEPAGARGPHSREVLQTDRRRLRGVR